MNTGHTYDTPLTERCKALAQTLIQRIGHESAALLVGDLAQKYGDITPEFARELGSAVATLSVGDIMAERAAYLEKAVNDPATSPFVIPSMLDELASIYAHQSRNLDDYAEARTLAKYGDAL